MVPDPRSGLWWRSRMQMTVFLNQICDSNGSKLSDLFDKSCKYVFKEFLRSILDRYELTNYFKINTRILNHNISKFNTIWSFESLKFRIWSQPKTWAALTSIRWPIRLLTFYIFHNKSYWPFRPSSWPIWLVIFYFLRNKGYWPFGPSSWPIWLVNFFLIFHTKSYWPFGPTSWPIWLVTFFSFFTKKIISHLGHEVGPNGQ